MIKKVLKLISLFTVVFLLLETNLVYAKTTNKTNPKRDYEGMVMTLRYKKDIISLLKYSGLENQRQMLCIALNIYHEVRGSVIEDKIASSFTVLNRVNDTRFPYNNYVRGRVTTLPQTPCGIIYDPDQYSWTSDGKTDYPRNKVAWKQAQELAYVIYNHDVFKISDPIDNIKHYVRYDYMDKPWVRRWSKKKRYDIKWGPHHYMKIYGDRPDNIKLKKKRLVSLMKKSVNIFGRLVFRIELAYDSSTNTYDMAKIHTPEQSIMLAMRNSEREILYASRENNNKDSKNALLSKNSLWFYDFLNK